MSCFVVGELEEQRKELEARRAMLEERYKLRVATAQEFGVIHVRRLHRVRDAFVKQCYAARRRNQDVVEKVHLNKEVLFGGNFACKAYTSRNRLSAQLDRFLSAAEKLYPAWQDQQLWRNAMKLQVLDEERFAVEQRRRAAQDRFRQEQAIAVAVQERRRRLATERIHERKDAAHRLSLREHSIAQAQYEGKIMLEHAFQAGRAARHDAVAILRQHAGRRYCERHCIGGEVESEEGKRSIGHASISGDTNVGCPGAMAANGTGMGITLSTGLDDNPLRAKKSNGSDSSCTGVVQPWDPPDALEPAEANSEEGERKRRGGGCGTRHDVCRSDGGRDLRECHSSKTTTRMRNHEGLLSSSPRSGNEGAAAAAGVAASLRRSCLPTGMSLLVPPPVEAEELSQVHNRAGPTPSQASVQEFELPYPPPLGLARSSNHASRRESVLSSTSANGLLYYLDEAERLEQKSDGGGENMLNQAGIWDGSETGSRRIAAAAVAAMTATVSRSDDDDNGELDHLQHQEHREQRDFHPFEDFATQKRSRALEKCTDINITNRNTGDVVDTNNLGKSDVGGSPNDHRRDDTAATASAEDSPPIADVDKPLSLPTAARALSALTLSVESLADHEAANFPRGAGLGSPSAFSILVDTYASATTAAPLSSVRAAVNKATAEAAATWADASASVPDERTDKHGPNASRSTGSVAMESFGLSTLCGAVLNLTTTYAGDILPVEMLSGLVTAAKVRAQHRQRSPAGMLHLFDALFTHVRRLGATGEIDPATVAALFVPCFAGVGCKVLSGRGDRGGGVRPEQRLRRKVSSLLEATADPNGPVPSLTFPFGATVPASAPIPSALGDGGDGGGSCSIGICKKSDADASSNFEGEISAYDKVPSQRENSLKKSSSNREVIPDSEGRYRTGSSYSDPPPVQTPQPLAPSFLSPAVKGRGATGGAKGRGSGSTVMASSGVLLGGGNRAVRKGMLDMSAMMVAAGGVSSAATSSYSLPEFEMNESLDDTF